MALKDKPRFTVRVNSQRLANMLSYLSGKPCRIGDEFEAFRLSSGTADENSRPFVWSVIAWESDEAGEFACAYKGEVEAC